LVAPDNTDSCKVNIKNNYNLHPDNDSLRTIVFAEATYDDTKVVSDKTVIEYFLSFAESCPMNSVELATLTNTVIKIQKSSSDYSETDITINSDGYIEVEKRVYRAQQSDLTNF